MINIAIDGTSGSGKSTVAKALGESLGFKVLDTGAIYRAIACEYLKQFQFLINEENLNDFLGELNVEIIFKNSKQYTLVNGFDYTSFLRQEEISMFSSKISAYSKVRDRVLKIQREFAKNNNAILEGRDIGTIVLPNADIKIFMTASQEERAKRRFEQLKLTDKSISFKKVLQDLKQRDFNDENREVAPLKPACDSIIFDNTGLSLKQTVEKCIEIINEKLHKNKGA